MGKTTVIKNGFVVDGTGSSGFHADVLIEGDRVIQIGSDLSGDCCPVISLWSRLTRQVRIDRSLNYLVQLGRRHRQTSSAIERSLRA